MLEDAAPLSDHALAKPAGLDGLIAFCYGGFPDFAALKGAFGSVEVAGIYTDRHRRQQVPLAGPRSLQHATAIGGAGTDLVMNGVAR